MSSDPDTIPGYTPEGGFEPERFRGLSHPEALERKVEPSRQLVERLVEAGTVGTIAGLPETFKTFLAMQTAFRVAVGGTVLGREVLRTGPVAYWWQDDSEENELARLQAYAHRHNLTGELPIRWHLNEGLVLPRDLDYLRDEVEREGQRLVVLDSLYNFVHGVGLKDEEIGSVLGLLKSAVCDPTGATVLVVDHAPWPTDGNRGQARAFGSVFKAAAIRWGVYIERVDGTLYVQAHGNNVTGLARTQAIFDPDSLELQIVEPRAATTTIADRIEDFLRRNPGATTAFVRNSVTGTDTEIDRLLEEDERFTPVPPKMYGKPSNATCWALTEDVPTLLGATSAEEAADVTPTLPPVTDETSAATPLSLRSREGSAPRFESTPADTPADLEDGGW